jgi:CYTH domain-containing protein
MFAGLVVAEVELNEDQEINQIPHWAGQEITGLGVLSNHSLATLAEQFRP